MKRFVILLLLPFVFLIAVCQPVEKLVDTIDTNITTNGVHRYRRTLKPAPTSCSVNQYFDKHEGRCLGAVGGGKVLYINDTVSCETNTLKPHCTNPRYYYICKKDKIILAQCTRGRHFENRLQKCAHVSRDAYETVTVNPKTETFDSFQPPECKSPGSFPLSNDCAQFYVCETTGHRLHQNFFRCPENTAYDRETEMCVPSDNCKGGKNLPSMCTWSIHKEKLTIEEAERWLNIWPLNKTRFVNSVVNVSKNFTLNENGSVTICETIFVPGESNVTATNIYETSTQSSNDVETTSVSYVKSTTSAFAEVSDKSDVITSTRRDVETSRPSNTIDVSTEAYPVRTEPAFVKETKEDRGNGGSSLETTTLVELTTSTDQSTASNRRKEMEINEPLSDMTTSTEPVLKDQYSTTEKVTESASTEVANIHDDSTGLPKGELSSSTEMDKSNSETSTMLKGPVSEDQNSTITPEESLVHTDSTVSNEHEVSSTTEREMEANTEASINKPLSDMTTLAEPILREQYSTTEKVIESSSSTVANIQDDSTILPKRELSNSTEMDNIETSTNGSSLEMTTFEKPVSDDQYSTTERVTQSSSTETANIHDDSTVVPKEESSSSTEVDKSNSETSTMLKGPVSEDQNSTIAPEESLVHTDPTVSNEHRLSSTTEREMEANTEASINEPLSDMTTSAEPVLKDQYSTTEKVIESSSTVANIHDDSTILPKRELSSSTEMDKHNSETSTNEPTTFKGPVSEDQNSTVAPEESLVQTDPTVSNEHQLSSTTEKEIEANINEPLSDMTTSAEPVLKDQYSTTEKMITSSEVPHIQDDPTMSANPSISSSTETIAQNTVASTESVSSNNNAAHVDRMTATSTPKNVHEFHEAITTTKATFVVNDTSSTTVSPNIKTANETFIDNAVPTSNVPANTESTFSVSEASESTTMKPIISPEELIANCMALSSSNGSLTSTQSNSTNAGKSSNSADNETRSKSFERQQNSHVTDNDGTKETVARKGIDTAPEYHGKTISKHVVLPIASAVLNITDKYERRLKYSLRNFLSRHALEHKKYA